MSHLGFIESYTKFCASRLYAQFVATMFSLFYVFPAMLLVSIFWSASKDAETGVLYMQITWVKSWLLVGSMLLLLYTLATVILHLASLRRYWVCRSDHRLVNIASYMLLLLFPVGTIAALFLFYRLDVEKQKQIET